LTGKFVDVCNALLWLIHDGRSGQCNPAYATIADKAGCAPSTVGRAIIALERSGILSWVNRIRRVGIRERDLFGQWTMTWRVLRTSNAYVFNDPLGRSPNAQKQTPTAGCGASARQTSAANADRQVGPGREGARESAGKPSKTEFRREPPDNIKTQAAAVMLLDPTSPVDRALQRFAQTAGFFPTKAERA
jgi:hypothetical protein